MGQTFGTRAVDLTPSLPRRDLNRAFVFNAETNRRNIDFELAIGGRGQAKNLLDEIALVSAKKFRELDFLPVGKVSGAEHMLAECFDRAR